MNDYGHSFCAFILYLVVIAIGVYLYRRPRRPRHLQPRAPFNYTDLVQERRRGREPANQFGNPQ
jgi:hypothetical protein